MNEFIKASIELEKKKELAKQIAICCLEINSIGDKRQIDIEEGKPCVFFYLAGHVGTIDIGVFEKGWKPDRDPDRNIYLDKYSKLSEFTDCLAYLDELYLGQTMEGVTEKKGDGEGKELSGETDRGEVFRSGRSYGRLLSNFMRKEPKRT